MRQQARGPILLTGASGFLGAYVLEALASERERDVFTAGRKAPRDDSRHLAGDLRDEGLHRKVGRLAPEVVIHLAAVAEPDRCEADASLARAVNEEAAMRLARHVSTSCRRFVYVSTDLVFDGREGGYDESAMPHPLSVYGRTKLAGEGAVRSVLGNGSVVVRLALLYGARRGPAARPSFAEAMVRRAEAGATVELFTDQVRSPLYAEDAALGLRKLLELDRPPSLLHFGGPEAASRYDMGLAVLRAFGLSESLARRRRMSDHPSQAVRPRDVSLDSSLAKELGLETRPLDEGLVAMKLELERSGS